MTAIESTIRDLVINNETRLLQMWIEVLNASELQRTAHPGGNDLRDQCSRFLNEFANALQGGGHHDIHEPSFAGLRDLLSEVSRTDAIHGLNPSETVLFALSLKEPLFTLLNEEFGTSGERLTAAILSANRLLDKLGLYASEVYQKSRDDIIRRQSQELIELSMPVVLLWDKILATPIIGTLDSERAQSVMESLLDQIVQTGAEIAIIDITGVSTVDTLVAQHLVKTISAARLMGADCILSGIRPQIAQTIVHLGLQLDVVSKATMADAFALALRRTGQRVQRIAANSD